MVAAKPKSSLYVASHDCQQANAEDAMKDPTVTSPKKTDCP